MVCDSRDETGCIRQHWTENAPTGGHRVLTLTHLSPPRLAVTRSVRRVFVFAARGSPAQRRVMHRLLPRARRQLPKLRAGR